MNVYLHMHIHTVNDIRGAQLEAVTTSLLEVRAAVTTEKSRRGENTKQTNKTRAGLVQEYLFQSSC